MCEQTSDNFNSGDVVWVKLGPCWWPGEVVPFEDLPNDITESFKKSPLYVVKFFDEEKYEFVRQLTNISPYNSDKKYDFIKKGLDLYRAKHSFMEKFRSDVITAEKKTDGDPNILSDPRLEPDKKPDIASIFGTPVSKKGKDSPSRAKGKSSTGKSHSSPGSAKKRSSVITHPRFLGKDDSEIRILVQTPKETKIPDPEYECYSCGFKCSRIEVIVFHNKSHLRGNGSPPSSPKKKKSPVKRTKKRRFPVSKTTTIDEDLELLRKGLPVCSEDSSDEESTFSSSSSSSSATSSSDEEPLIKRKAKVKPPARSKKPKPSLPVPPPPPEVKKQTDICTDLLAEWDDDDEEEEESQPIAERLSPIPTVEQHEETKNDPPKIDKGEKEKEKSCFDFEEDEEALLTTVEGRKIPRVIPQTDRRKSTQDNEKILEDKSRSVTPKSIEDSVIESETYKPKEIKAPEPETSDSESIERKKESQFQMEFEAFNNALKETTVPKILDIPLLHKYEQNFHNAKTIKFPDKVEEETCSTKDPTPPPLDLEVLPKSGEEPVESKEVESVPEPPPPIEPIKEPVVKNTEVATKLTNPKKRFVKTFEDETKNSSKESTTKETKETKEGKQEPALESIENELKSLEVSKLKTQLMKKLSDGSINKETVKQVEKRSRKTRSFVEVKKILPAESLDKKRSILETASDNESKTHAKKKKYTSDYLDNSTKTRDVKVTVIEVKGVQKSVEEEIKEAQKESLEKHQSVEIKPASHLEYLNTSPSKIFSELRVDKDELLDVASLSESQRLTIQNIIGVTSPVIPTQPPVNEEKVEKEQTVLVRSETKEKQDSYVKVELETKHSEAKDIPEQRTHTRKEIEEIITGTIEERVKDIMEEKSTHVDSSNQMFKISERLEETISEKPPDEIIERPKEDIIKETEEKLSEKKLDEVVHESKKEDDRSDISKPSEENRSLEENKSEQSVESEEVSNQAKKEEKVITEEIENFSKDKIETKKSETKEIPRKAKGKKGKAKGSRHKRGNKEKRKETKGKSKDIKEKVKANKGEPKENKEKVKDSREEPKEKEQLKESKEKPKENKDKLKESKEKSKDNKEKPKENKEKLKEDKEKPKENKEKPKENREKSKENEEPKETEKFEEPPGEEIKGEIITEDKEENLKTEIEEVKPKTTEENLTKEEPIIVDEVIETAQDKPIVEIDTEPKPDTEKSAETPEEESQEIPVGGSKPVSPEPIVGKSTSDLVKSILKEDEMVNIEGNVTVVTESDLADKQVEIATTPEVSRPITLASFSMDFEELEPYVKGETIKQDLQPKMKSPSPIIEEKKPTNKDGQKTVVETPIISAEKIPPEELVKELHTGESRGRKRKTEEDTLTLDVQGKENECVKLKKFEDVTPAKESLPSVIMEGFDDSLKDDVPDDTLTIDESNVKDQVPPEKSPREKENVIMESVENILIDDNKEVEIPQNIIREIMPKEEIIIPPIDISVESEVAKITDSIAEQEIIIHDNHHSTSSTKLLEILTDKPKSTSSKTSPILSSIGHMDDSHLIRSKAPYKHAKFIPKQSTAGPSRTPKATILSDQLIKPLDESKTVSVKKVTSKRSYQDVEDIDTYIIQKPIKKMNISGNSEPSTPKVIKKTPAISKGKARILQQTIITPTGDILQPPVSQAGNDDNMFDINSMPIVLSDQILTPEGIENMPIVLQDTPVTTSKTQINPIKKTPTTQPQPQQVRLLNKTQSTVVGMGMKDTILKTPLHKTSPATTITKQKLPKMYPTATTTPRIIKHNPSVIAQPGKQGNFIIVPATTTATGSKYTVGKRQTIVKKPPPKIVTPIGKIPDTTPMTSSGNKIMILKGQGQQQKILLTTSQKQLPPSKIKGRTIAQNKIISKESPQQKGANIISQTIVNSKGQITTLASQSPIGTRGHQIVTAVAQSNRNIKIDPMKMKRIPQQRIGLASEIIKPSTSGQQRTIIIKNPQGQTVKKIQGTDDALLDQQVAEQLQAISRATANQQLKDLSSRTSMKLPAKKPYLKKSEPIKQTLTKTILHNTQVSAKNVTVPPLAPISPTKKVDAHFIESSEVPIAEEKSEEAKRPPHQLVIQDAQGNQTTITEGQILALPSEAIDGQPHSYVLVTLDETGNLAPLNSEALMSLDPNLNLTSDLGNMVLQIDQGATAEAETPVTETPQQQPPPETVEVADNTENMLVKESGDKPSSETVLMSETPASEGGDQNVQAVINSGEMGQLIITGDAATAQKFLESLAEGNADLANLLANAEGNVLIQADGQQILINTDSENPMLVMNPESISNENSEGSGNPIFASQPVKNQDILAAALADTDVFQPDQSISHSPSKVVQSQLSPNSALYPINVTNVLETNSMSSPIMTPLEVPSTNSKKIDDENEILNQVPKNVDLPITITDPNISQTVAQQQVASLMASGLQTNLDLPLAIQDPGLSGTSAEINSPFVYSLPTLDDTVDINQKTFSGSISMPLLTEEPEDSIAETSTSTASIAAATTTASSVKEPEVVVEKKDVEVEVEKKEEIVAENMEAKKSIEEEEEEERDDKKTDFIGGGGLCSMRGAICNSLSEPPPDMFDFSVNQYEPSRSPDMPIASTASSETCTTLNDRESSVSSLEERKNEESGGGGLYAVNMTSPSTNTDDSCEIPVQPPIIAKPFEENGTGDSRLGGEESKKGIEGEV